MIGNENRCVCCGAERPEGRMICPTCERNGGPTNPSKKEATKNVQRPA